MVLKIERLKPKNAIYNEYLLDHVIIRGREVKFGLAGWYKKINWG